MMPVRFAPVRCVGARAAFPVFLPHRCSWEGNANVTETSVTAVGHFAPRVRDACALSSVAFAAPTRTFLGRPFPLLRRVSGRSSLFSFLFPWRYFGEEDARPFLADLDPGERNQTPRVQNESSAPPADDMEGPMPGDRLADDLPACRASSEVMGPFLLTAVARAAAVQLGSLLYFSSVVDRKRDVFFVS